MSGKQHSLHDTDKADRYWLVIVKGIGKQIHNL